MATTLPEGLLALLRKPSPHKYLGTPYPNFTGRPEIRVIVTVEADRVTPPPGE